MEAKITIDTSLIEAAIKKAVASVLAEYFPNATTTSNNTRKDDELIGTTEACRILGCCSRTMQRYRDGKYFTVVMVGPKKAMYYRSEILAFRDAHTRVDRNHK